MHAAEQDVGWGAECMQDFQDCEHQQDSKED